MRAGPVTVSGGFVLMAALIYLLDDAGLAPLLLAAILAHELGHFAAIRALGGRVLGLHLGLVGLRMDYEGEGLSYPGEVLIALAGPLTSLLLAYGASWWGRAAASETAYSLAGISLILCLFNLAPVYPLDGGRAVYFLSAWRLDLPRAERLVCVVSCAVSFLLLGLGAALLIWTRRNFTLLLVAIWLLIGYCKNGGNTVKYTILQL